MEHFGLTVRSAVGLRLVYIPLRDEPLQAYPTGGKPFPCCRIRTREPRRNRCSPCRTLSNRCSPRRILSNRFSPRRILSNRCNPRRIPSNRFSPCRNPSKAPLRRQVKICRNSSSAQRISPPKKDCRSEVFFPHEQSKSSGRTAGACRSDTPPSNGSPAEIQADAADTED